MAVTAPAMVAVVIRRSPDHSGAPVISVCNADEATGLGIIIPDPELASVP